MKEGTKKQKVISSDKMWQHIYNDGQRIFAEMSRSDHTSCIECGKSYWIPHKAKCKNIRQVVVMNA